MAGQWHKFIYGCESSLYPLQESGHHNCLYPQVSLSVPLPHSKRRLSYFRSFHLITYSDTSLQATAGGIIDFFWVARAFKSEVLKVQKLLTFALHLSRLLVSACIFDI